MINRISRDFFILMLANRLFDVTQNNISHQKADPTLLGDRNYSDNGRMTQAKEAWQEILFLQPLAAVLARELPLVPSTWKSHIWRFFVSKQMPFLQFFVYFYRITHKSVYK